MALTDTDGPLEGDPNFMLSLARGLSVIQAFDGQASAMTIAEAARRTGLSRAAARRCLYTLAQLGFVASNGRDFALTPKVLALGHAFLTATPIVRAAQPVLERLSERLDEACSLAVLEGEDIVYLARVAARRITSVGITIGTRLPAYCTAIGRAILASRSDQELDHFLGQAQIRPLTSRTIVDREALKAELLDVRQRGFAVVDQEFEVGVLSVAVPVTTRQGEVVGAINVGTQALRLRPRDVQDRFVPQLLEAAHEIALAAHGGTPQRLPVATA